MKFQELLDMVAENPEMAEYELCLSDFFVYEDDEEVTLVSDFPIATIASNDEEKELRFVLRRSDMTLLEQSRDRIMKILREKLDDHET